MIIKLDELDKLQKDVEEIKKILLSAEFTNKGPEYVTAEKAAEILGTTTQTLYNHAKKGLYPKYKFGDRTVFYKLSEIYKAFKPFKNR